MDMNFICLGIVGLLLMAIAIPLALRLAGLRTTPALRAVARIRRLRRHPGADTKMMPLVFSRLALRLAGLRTTPAL